MIQRIQSVYLLGAFILLELAASMLYVMPELMLGGFRMVFAGLLAANGLGGLGAIFLFARRDLQSKIVGILVVISILLIVALLGVLYATEDLALIVTSRSFGAIIGVVISPVVAFWLFLRAGKAIQRDIDLIRSMDRLR